MKDAATKSKLPPNPDDAWMDGDPRESQNGNDLGSTFKETSSVDGSHTRGSDDPNHPADVDDMDAAGETPSASANRSFEEKKFFESEGTTDGSFAAIDDVPGRVTENGGGGRVASSPEGGGGEGCAQPTARATLAKSPNGEIEGTGGGGGGGTPADAPDTIGSAVSSDPPAETKSTIVVPKKDSESEAAAPSSTPPLGSLVDSMEEENKNQNEEMPRVIACYLCRRKFPSIVKLKKHEAASDMHKQNLERHKRGDDTPMSRMEAQRTRKRKLAMNGKARAAAPDDGGDGKKVKTVAAAGGDGAIPALPAGQATGEERPTSKESSEASFLLFWKCATCQLQFDSTEEATRHEAKCIGPTILAEDTESASDKGRRSGRIKAKENREISLSAAAASSSGTTPDDGRPTPEGNEHGTSFSLDLTSDERTLLSEFNALLLDNVEIFVVGEAFNRQLADWAAVNLAGGAPVAKYRPHGSVGLRCVHCRDVPLVQQAAPSSHCFMGKISKMGGHAHAIGAHHLTICPHVPSETRRVLAEAKVTSKSESLVRGKIGLNRFMSDMSEVWGLRDTLAYPPEGGSPQMAVTIGDAEVVWPDRDLFLVGLESEPVDAFPEEEGQDETEDVSEADEGGGRDGPLAATEPSDSAPSLPEPDVTDDDEEVDARMPPPKKRSREKSALLKPPSPIRSSSALGESPTLDESSNLPSSAAVVRSVFEPFRLSLPDMDKEHLCPLMCYLRRHCIEIFSASETDVELAKGGKKLKTGQVGIRCVFCKNEPHELRTKRHSVFPSRTTFLYDAFSSLRNAHLGNPGKGTFCKDAPRKVRDAISDLRTNGLEGSRNPRDYFERTARDWFGMYNTTAGMQVAKWGGGKAVADLEVSEEEHEEEEAVDKSEVSNPTVLPAQKSKTAEQDKKLKKAQEMEEKDEDAKAGELGSTRYRPPFTLEGPEDAIRLSEVHHLTRTLLEIFIVKDKKHATRIRGRHLTRVVPGQCGVRCKYCQENGIGSGAPKFPGSLANLYHSARKFTYEHFESCPLMPSHVRAEFMKKRRAKAPRKADTTQYYVESAEALGLYDLQSNGIGYDRSLVLLKDFGSDDVADGSEGGSSSDEEGESSHAASDSYSGGSDNNSQSPESTWIQKDPPTPGTVASLIRLSDRDAITDFKYKVYDQLSICYFTETDRQAGNRSAIGTGFPGVRCRHCNVHKCFARSGRIMSKSALPSAVTHLLNCRSVPRKVKSALRDAKGWEDAQRQKLPKGQFWPVHDMLWESMIKESVREGHLSPSDAVLVPGGERLKFE